MAGMGLATYQDYLRFVPGTALTQATVEAYLSAAEWYIERRAGRPLCVMTTTEYLDGVPGPDLPLPRRPVRAVASVYVDPNGGFGQGDDPFPASTLLTAGTHYRVDLPRNQLTLTDRPLWWPYTAFVGPAWTGRARYRGLAGGGTAGWPLVAGCVKVTYTAGLTAELNPGVVQAIVELATLQAEAVPGGGLIAGSVSYIDVSESGRQFLEQTYAGGKVPLPGSVQSVLAILSTPADRLPTPPVWAH